MRHRLRALTAIIAVATEIFTCVVLVVMVVLAAWQVTGRYVFNATPTWTEQLTILLIGYLVLPMAALGIRMDFHIAIASIVAATIPSLRRALDRLVFLIFSGFGGAMAYYGYVLAERSTPTRIPLLGISRTYNYLPLVIGGGLIVLFAVERLLNGAPDDAAADGEK